MIALCVCKIERVRESPPFFLFFLVAHCSVHNDSMKSGGERQTHCTAAQEREREGEGERAENTQESRRREANWREL